MKTQWTSGLNEEKIEEIRREFASSGILRDRLKEILSKKENAARNTAIGKEEYEVANWAYKQADTNGYLRALREISSLL